MDSTSVITRIWEQWAVEHGFPPAETALAAHGKPSLESIRELLPDADHQALNRELEQREIDDTDGIAPVPGALQFLAALPEDRWTIVTSCSRALAEARIRAGGLHIPPKLITSSDITNGKPHPEPYLKGAAVLGSPAADCIAFEDAPAGIRSAKAAGARVVGLRSTDSDEALVAAGADWLVDDFTGMSATFDNASATIRLSLP